MQFKCICINQGTTGEELVFFFFFFFLSYKYISRIKDCGCRIKLSDFISFSPSSQNGLSRFPFIFTYRSSSSAICYDRTQEIAACAAAAASSSSFIYFYFFHLPTVHLNRHIDTHTHTGGFLPRSKEVLTVFF